MLSVLKLSRRARWAVPVGALVVTGAVMAGSLMSVAQAAPVLPPRTPAQLLAAVAQGQAPALTGTVLETVSLGLPALPDTGNPTSIAALLTGSHTIQVWYASPRRYRLAVPQSLSETDVVRNGSTVWLWQSTLNTVTKFTVPATGPPWGTEPAALGPDPAAGRAAGAEHGGADHHGERRQQRNRGGPVGLRARARAQGLTLADRAGPDRHRREQQRAAAGAGFRPRRGQPSDQRRLYRHQLRRAVRR